MANVFEQLENLDSVSEPRHAFEDIVTSMLLDCGYTDGRVKVFRGDGGIDAFKGLLAKGSKPIVYQSKYFTRPWGKSQKQQIRDSFTTVKRSYTLKKWFLCTPSRPTKEDLRWFDTWRKGQKAPKVPIELIDGDDLARTLDAPCASRARQRLRDWGVLSVPGGASIIQGIVRCIPLTGTTRGAKFHCNIAMKNSGDVTAEDVRITFSHSPNHAFPGSINETFWEELKSAMFDVRNPITLRAKFGVHPGESFALLQLPLDAIGTSPFPFMMSMEYWVRDQRSGRQFLTIETPVETEAIFHFKPGETEKKQEFASDNRVILPDLEYPTDGPLRGILDQIAGHKDHREFGFSDLGADGAQPTQANFRPHLSRAGAFERMSRETLTRALKELVNLGWLLPLDDPRGGTCRYQLTDAAKASSAFTKQVEYYKSLRERPR